MAHFDDAVGCPPSTQPSPELELFAIGGDLVFYTRESVPLRVGATRGGAEVPRKCTGRADVQVGSLHAGSLHAGSLHAGSLHAGSLHASPVFAHRFETARDGEVSGPMTLLEDHRREHLKRAVGALGPSIERTANEVTVNDDTYATITT